ncbi:hypothetical protein CAP35_09390 [Chitinophagaceae bacterium IBVUCB1]|nr:hypothetical protein CAP35_09390 [Chitinophagaceae bacterium IBVUCB1]
MNYLKTILLSAVTLAGTALYTSAQVQKPVARLEVAEAYSTANDGFIACYVYKPSVKGTVSVSIFAQNDQRAIPMQLRYKKGALPVKLRLPAANTPYYQAVKIPLSKILITKPSAEYSWMWRGKAKAPASPIVAMDKVNSIKWWAVVTIGKTTYTTDTLTTTIE